MSYAGRSTSLRHCLRVSIPESPKFVSVKPWAHTPSSAPRNQADCTSGDRLRGGFRSHRDRHAGHDRSRSGRLAPGRAALSSAVLNAARQTGGVLGVAVLGSVIEPHADLPTLHVAMVVSPAATWRPLS